MYDKFKKYTEMIAIILILIILLLSSLFVGTMLFWMWN